MLIKSFKVSAFAFLIFGMALPSIGICQDSVTLHGKVMNKKTQEGIHGLEVVILSGNDTLVSVTNRAGEYQINNIPKGTYDVLFQRVNYGNKILKNVNFNQDTVRKNVQLRDKIPYAWRWCPGTPPLESPSFHFSLDDLTGNVKFDGERLQRQLK